MNEISIATYLLLCGWATYEAVVTYSHHNKLIPKRAKKLTQTLFTILLLFLLGHFIILSVIISPEWSVPEYGLWFYYGFNFALLRGIHILRVEIEE